MAKCISRTQSGYGLGLRTRRLRLATASPGPESGACSLRYDPGPMPGAVFVNGTDHDRSRGGRSGLRPRLPLRRGRLRSVPHVSRPAVPARPPPDTAASVGGPDRACRCRTTTTSFARRASRDDGRGRAGAMDARRAGRLHPAAAHARRRRAHLRPGGLHDADAGDHRAAARGAARRASTRTASASRSCRSSATHPKR